MGKFERQFFASTLFAFSPKARSISSCCLLSGVIASAALIVSGCGNPAEVAVKKLFQPSPDKDVTADPYYNFSPFTNTIWKTKTKTAVAETKRYTGAAEFTLLAPSRFDPTLSEYTSVRDMKLIAVLPPGSRLRITRLLKDQGAWGGVQVEGVVEAGTNGPKAVYLDGLFLANSHTNWDVNPDMLTHSDDASPSASSATEISDSPQAGYQKGYGNGKERAILANNALPQNKRAAIKGLSDPWLELQTRPVAVRIYGEDYVAKYEAGCRKGFEDYFNKH